MRVPFRAKRSLLFLAAAVLLGGCRTASSGPTDAETRDVQIERDLRIEFHADARLRDVWPECGEGAVTLLGQVTSPEAKRAAEAVARRRSGGRRVVNQIEVREK